MKVVNVAVGVILRAQKVFISKRADHLHQGGLWEFPGGKVESDETVEQALTRELSEEVGIHIVEHARLMTIEHDYGDKKVRLHVHTVTEFTGEPTQLEGQIARWVGVAELRSLAFPEANQPIIDKLAYID